MKTKNYFVVLNDHEKFENLLNELKRKYNIDDFDIKILDAEIVDIKKIINETSFLPVLSDKVLIIIKNVENFTKKECEILYDFLNKLPKDTLVILFGTSIEEPFEESSLKEKIVSYEEKFFSKIYSLKRENGRGIYEILQEYMKVKEKNFPLLITGVEIYLRNVIKNKKELTDEIIKKFELLHNLDYFLKVGRVELGLELEIYLLYYFFSASS
jgi:replication-associated recombination protein RarA